MSEPQLRDAAPCFSPAFFRAICEFLQLLTQSERRAPQEEVARRRAHEQEVLDASAARQHDVSLADARRAHRISRWSSLGCLSVGVPPELCMSPQRHRVAEQALSSSLEFTYRPAHWPKRPVNSRLRKHWIMAVMAAMIQCWFEREFMYRSAHWPKDT